ncbi:MAG: EscU/YscU/HrcU family type III secretion system export apparatus switch protein [Gammaproteobacteria bacterium]|nr:EscU/YscU/HrcU family type III secretion system export apparatus switch protein [Gammaproteobacteria bacterium]MDH5729793.1 EscU/YscU/HrcU family type III secretion system export apparatus switch protein [Gammaproteobacteria bacterium]
MAEEQQEQDKSENATPFKLKEARKRGQVSKSLEVNSFLILSVCIAVFLLMGDSMVMQQTAIASDIMSIAASFQFDAPHLIHLLDNIVSATIQIFWPLAFMVIVVGLLSTMLQTGPVFSFFPIKPDAKRLNPVSGFKRLFSARLLYESVKTTFKLFLFAMAIGLLLSSIFPSLMALPDIDPDYYAKFLLQNTIYISAAMLATYLVVVAIDFVYTRWEFSKKMKMSRRELKDEVKRREGDPQVRSKIKDLQRENAKRSGSLQAVKNADVLITNPTHLSIALRYKREEMSSPKLVAKGAGELAQRMRIVARQHGVPILEDKTLARALFRKVGIDAFVPEIYFVAAARALVWAYSQKQNSTS